MAMRHRRKPDGRGPFLVAGEPYVEPAMSRFEVPTVVARRFQPNQEIPLYAPESDLFPLGEGLSGYFEGTRTPTEVQTAREETERLRMRINDAQSAREVQRTIELAKLDLIRLSGVIGGPSPEVVRDLFGTGQRIAPTPGNIPQVRDQLAHEFIQLPQEQREEVLQNTGQTETLTDAQGRKLQRIYPQPYRKVAARPYTRHVPHPK